MTRGSIRAVTPAIEGWFTTGAEPALLGSRVHDVRVGVLPADRGVLPQPGLRRRGVRGDRAVPPRDGVVLHRRAVPAAPAVHPGQRSLRAVRPGRGRAARGDRRAGPARRRLRRRATSGSAARSSWSWRRCTPTTSGERTIWRWLPWTCHSPSWARRPTSEPRRRRPRSRHAPLGQVGPQLRQLRRARGACRRSRTPTSRGRTSTSSSVARPCATATAGTSPAPPSPRRWAGTARASRRRTPPAPPAPRRSTPPAPGSSPG